ncbi:NAD-dependent epimerase/dehydratase family protein [Heyndrickxia acidicola]|uniref:NAD-dependent epimerase/dehydratase family protein n=1 Tax=Heyndrickxia acidicola TaxID=209389 RepID=A0ABU6MM66_9BACI|nr:NAD-dependent epimerase/dehydratase family protein [Heyndrickxia acidicola]MED1205778.1 NAD-dependent epimerase/dehydratase family protein [Heyndrickxia acidicola]
MESDTTYLFVTGCAGFIGFHLSNRLLEEGYYVLGLDNMNPYYDPALKNERLKTLKSNPNFQFVKGSIENLELLESLFEQYPIKLVIHLAAQAGVRFSIDHPHTYIQSNLVGFFNVLECCRNYDVHHLLYASSSSVYGGNKDIPFSEEHRTDHPVSLYAATKKANELMAYSYSHLYHIPTTGLRFFTVYGPWGRPDMVPYKFAKLMMEKKPIDVYNQGLMKRDFTYIDDVTESIFRLMKKAPLQESDPPFNIYNIGNQNPVLLNDLISVLEKELYTKAMKNFLPMQAGDVPLTYADVSELTNIIHYSPNTSIEEGIKKFSLWFKDYYSWRPEK